MNNKALENQKELELEIKAIDSKLQVFREDKVLFNKILGQELSVYLSNPQALEDLVILKQSVSKVVELGEATSTSTEMIDKLLLLTARLKRQIGGLDMQKRHKELLGQGSEQRERLAGVKKRLERIGKGASDCDGYTSNTEEATFIVNYSLLL